MTDDDKIILELGTIYTIPRRKRRIAVNEAVQVDELRTLDLWQQRYTRTGVPICLKQVKPALFLG